MQGILMPRLISGDAIIPWHARMNAVLISTTKTGAQTIGYQDNPRFGSITDNSVDTFGGAILDEITVTMGTATFPSLSLTIKSQGFPNSGWDFLTINGKVFERSAAGYYANAPLAPDKTRWTWINTEAPFIVPPFSAPTSNMEVSLT